MEHPWAQLLRFSEIQFEGPCEDHVLAIKGPYFGHFLEKRTKGFAQNFEIWHGTSLDTLVKIQEEPFEDIVLAIKVPYFGYF